MIVHRHEKEKLRMWTWNEDKVSSAVGCCLFFFLFLFATDVLLHFSGLETSSLWLCSRSCVQKFSRCPTTLESYHMLHFNSITCGHFWISFSLREKARGWHILLEILFSYCGAYCPSCLSYIFLFKILYMFSFGSLWYLSWYNMIHQVLPVGREMLACSLAFKEVASSYICRSAVPLIFSQIQTSNQDEQEKNESDTYHDSSNVDNWCCFSPLLKCWKRLLKCIGVHHPSDYLVETVYSLTLGALALSQYGEK